MLRKPVLLMALAMLGPSVLGAQQLDATVATVTLTKTQAVTLSALKAQLAAAERIFASQGRAMSDTDRTAILNDMIDMILFQQAAERDHVQVSDAQVNGVLEQNRQTYEAQLGRAVTLDDLKAQVVAGGQTWGAWLGTLRDRLLPQLYVMQLRSKDIQAVGGRPRRPSGTTTRATRCSLRMAR